MTVVWQGWKIFYAAAMDDLKGGEICVVHDYSVQDIREYKKHWFMVHFDEGLSVT